MHAASNLFIILALQIAGEPEEHVDVGTGTSLLRCKRASPDVFDR